MVGCMKGCVSTVGLVVVTLAVGYAGWRWGGPVFAQMERVAGVEVSRPEGSPPAPSAATAEETMDRFEAFRTGGEGDRLRLEGHELSSVLQFSVPGIVPPGVHDPTVRLADGGVTLSARVSVDAFPDMPALDEVAGLLPDTVDLVLRGVLLPFDDGHAALNVERIEASRIPLPGRMIPGILRALGRRDREGLPATALAIPLPQGLASAYVEEDRLVLVSDR